MTSKLDVLEQEKTNMRTLLNEAGVDFLAKKEEVTELTKIVIALKVRSYKLLGTWTCSVKPCIVTFSVLVI